ncbi:hypothetical protein Q2941_50680, partial [Bradyrhizobium sp. UFLA05-153]
TSAAICLPVWRCRRNVSMTVHVATGSPLKHFAYDLRQIARRQTLPGYQLVISCDPRGTERLNFAPALVDPFAGRPREHDTRKPGDKL